MNAQIESVFAKAQSQAKIQHQEFGVVVDNFSIGEVDKFDQQEIVFSYFVPGICDDMNVKIIYNRVDEDIYDVQIKTFSDAASLGDTAAAVAVTVNAHKRMGHDVLDTK